MSHLEAHQHISMDFKITQETSLKFYSIIKNLSVQYNFEVNHLRCLKIHK